MATILLSAVGAAVGGLSSGTVLGLTGAVIGRAVGATLGRVIDQRLLGVGSDPVERGRVEQFRFTGTNAGGSVARLYGRMRVGGQVIWATQFVEKSQTSGGGKGAPPQPKTTTYSYCVSLAVALCEGEIRRVGRVWADGAELDLSTVTMRVYTGSKTQMPDPLMEAVEGAGEVPAYRGIAYVVFEDLDLTDFGNRVPQLAFEVSRPARPEGQLLPGAADLVTAVALMPGTGEYVLATEPVTYDNGFGNLVTSNVSSEGGKTDFVNSVAQLRDEVPNLQSVSLIYSWFGDDLRAGSCSVQPKVEDASHDGKEQPWTSGGIDRSSASEISATEGRPVYGGTPSDSSVVQAIQELNNNGQAVLFYPFLLMEILAGNQKPDPWSDNAHQPALPWRGRITGDKALGQVGSTDGTAQNNAAVQLFFGSAQASDFSINGSTVSYSGPNEWSYSRFILHAAALCAAAGGVDAFCIGSEMRGLTQMRDSNGFPAVQRFIDLASQVRQLLPNAKLSYAADWSEYFGYHPQDGSGDVYFHLDPLWAHGDIDFIGIDNYMPLSDWRDEDGHADAAWGAIHNLDYLRANIEGGEGYDWYYASDQDRDAQIREPITDGAYDEPWTFRYKDLRGWWEHEHYNRVNAPSAWAVPNGDRPDLWSAVSGAGMSAFAGSYLDGQFTNAVRVTDTVGGVTARVESADFQSLSNQLYLFRIFYRAGSAGTVRVTLDHRSPTPEWVHLTGAPGGLSVSLADDHVVQNVENMQHADGTYEVRFEVILSSTDPAANLGFGPRTGQAGDDVIFVGAQVIAREDFKTDWVPRSKPFWFTEIGCAAIDKGTNQPNKFLDEKSSESAIPHFSSGRRDDLIQAQYLRATMSYWSDVANNPISDVYGAPMLDMSRAHVWAWDARPWPAFPNDRDRWSDGGNWGRGHWVTGRIEACPLDHVVAELCEVAGVPDYDVSKLYGLVRGHLSGETEGARARLQSLMLSHGFQAVERNGKLVFQPLPTQPDAVILDGSTALGDDGSGGFAETRSAEAETTGRVRVSYTAAENTYEARVADAVFPGDSLDAISASEIPVALTNGEGQAIAERWLAEARVARDQLKFSLPPSQRGIGAGSMVALEDGSTWRVDRVEDRGARAIEAVRVEPSVFVPSVDVVETVPPSEFIAPTPVSPVFMDLPLLTGKEEAHAPHLAVTAKPWPGTVAAYSSASADGFALNRLLERRAVAGTLVTPMHRASPGLWDRSGPVRVQIASGALSGSDLQAVLNGANVAAIGSGDVGDWEVIQFAGATLVGNDLWELGLRLRGQQGTDGIMPDVWPEGSIFVLLDGAPQQVELQSSARGLPRHYRIGPARRSVDDASFVSRELAFRGVGLRPYAPVHLRASPAGGDMQITWIRRSRIDADSWEGIEVPLGEASEAYVLRVRDALGVRREETLTAPAFTYTQAMQSSDAIASPYTIEVAQVSESFGLGPFARIEINV